MSNPSPNREGDPSDPKASWYQVTLSAIGDAVLTADPAGLVTYMNPVAESLTGWSAVEAVGQRLENVFRIITEETREPIEQPVRMVIDTGLVRGLANHMVLVAKDGSELPIDDSAAPVWGKDGNLVGVVMVFRDITQRRQSEQIIESARGYAESIVNTVREPLLILNADLHVRSANRSFYEMFRVGPSETEGQFIYNLGDSQRDISAPKTLLEEIIPQNSSFDHFEVEHDFETIGAKTMLLNARRFPPEGRWELILLAIEDVTERRRAERAVEDSARRKDEFLAVMAHELRNPLSAISMAAYLLKEKELDQDRSWGLEVISHQVKNLNRLIEDLLDISRISHGKIRLRKEVMDLGQAIARAVEGVTASVTEKQHELIVSIPSEPMMIEGDPMRLEQVFGNLLTNAAKYTTKVGRIAVSAEVAEGDFLIRVRDNGEGIAAELLPGVFELFTQVESSAHHSRDGLGIGLYLVWTLVQMHGGSIEVASEGAGLGSEFTIRLPALVR